MSVIDEQLDPGRLVVQKDLRQLPEVSFIPFWIKCPFQDISPRPASSRIAFLFRKRRLEV